MNKLIRQIARFILDGKHHWDMLNASDKNYLIDIFLFSLTFPFKMDGLPTDERQHPEWVKNEIKKLIPCFFEERLSSAYMEY
jgi:hypothetical protein